MSVQHSPNEVRLKRLIVKIETQLSPDGPIRAHTFEHSFQHLDHLPSGLEPRLRSSLADLISHLI